MTIIVRLPPIPAHTPAEDMQHLTHCIRALFGIRSEGASRMPLGGGLFDVVITGGGDSGRAAVAVMDDIQLGMCGPVIEDPDDDWLYWLVPPGTTARWEPHPHGVCIGSPHMLTMPTLSHSEPPGPFWLRPCKSDRLVPPRQLRALLDQFQLQPTPHEAISALLGLPVA